MNVLMLALGGMDGPPLGQQFHLWKVTLVLEALPGKDRARPPPFVLDRPTTFLDQCKLFLGGKLSMSFSGLQSLFAAELALALAGDRKVKRVVEESIVTGWVETMDPSSRCVCFGPFDKTRM